MKSLELFAGSGNISKAFRYSGYETYTLDIEDLSSKTADIRDKGKFSSIFEDLDDNIHYKMDIMNFNYKQYSPGYFHIIWASPPCTFFSKLSTRYHWKNIGGIMVPDIQVIESLKLVIRTIEIIDYLKPDYFFIENPAGHLKKFYFMKFAKENLVYLCNHGKNYQKPTYIWSNIELPAEKCTHKRHLETITNIDKKSNRAILPIELGYYLLKMIDDNEIKLKIRYAAKGDKIEN